MEHLLVRKVILNISKYKHKPGLNCSAVILVIHIPTPSINANKMAPTAADLTAADGPPTDDEKYSLVDMFVKVWWPYGWCARLWVEQSKFEPWPGALCFVLGQDTLHSQCLSPPSIRMGTLGCNHVMD